ncbi:MAG: MAE_28990/MAE_18760 family HEPN-like nuclease [Magnetococcus sp. THC-1_WYH]
MKLKTLTDLQNFLDSDFSWRSKEISSFNLEVKSPRSKPQKSVIRAGVVLLYAHWEGFIKNASRGYLTFINNKGKVYSDLDMRFLAIGVKNKIGDLRDSQQTYSNLETIKYILEANSKKTKLDFDKAIDMESNLSSSVFKNIAFSIGIDISLYSQRFQLIDARLLKQRHAIAHGEKTDIDKGSYIDLSKEVIGLMRQFKTDIENAASTEKYLAK